MDTLEIQSSTQPKSCMIRVGTICTVYVFTRTVQSGIQSVEST